MSFEYKMWKWRRVTIIVMVLVLFCFFNLMSPAFGSSTPEPHLVETKHVLSVQTPHTNYQAQWGRENDIDHIVYKVNSSKRDSRVKYDAISPSDKVGWNWVMQQEKDPNTSNLQLKNKRVKVLLSLTEIFWWYLKMSEPKFLSDNLRDW